ncbi:MAG TPA: hypothetical protein VMY37_08165 [Thermoguttaceae bacterium]|nr:hypothetical protein [Thermoguttaceae bacterium]
MKSPARTSSLLLALFGVLAAVGWSAGHALGAEEEPVRVVLHPAPAPRPVLKYQLLPTLYERRPGNAVVFYGRVKAEQTAFFSSKEIWENIHRALEAPLEEVRGMEGILRSQDGPIFRNMERGGQCDAADWQYPVEEERYFTLIPDAQGQREFARILMADARGRIARGDFDGALRSLKVGYAMARHTADAPFIVSGLVGVAISDMMNDCLLELIQQPGAPNLYWSLTYLPQPFLDTRPLFEGEMLAFGYAFPPLTDADYSISDPEYWRRQLEEIGELHAEYSDEYPGKGPEEQARFRREILVRLLRGYPLAKGALVEQGTAPEEVEAMAVGQVILLHTTRQFDELRDELLECVLLPYWQARPHMEALEERMRRAHGQWEEALPLCDRHFPAVQAAHGAFARLDRQIALLRLIEALRLHGASHDGRLPERLDDVGVPVPIDPITGKPFEYRVEGAVAHVNGPPMPGRPCRYEIRLASEDTR